LIRRAALLTAVFTLVALATSRLALVGHELVGHGLLAVALGADLVGYRLFLFGGGWVTYRWPTGGPSGASELAVALGGIAIELAVAAVALMAARRCRGPVARVAAVASGTILILHAGFYLAAGTWHGFGDGRVLNEALGSWRPLLVVPVAVAVVAAGFLLGRQLAREVVSWVGGGALARAGQIAAAALLAAAVHGGLMWGEHALTPDQTYARVMEHESVRLVARDLGRFEAQATRMRGRAPSAAEIAAARARFEAEHQVFPLAPVLAVLLGLACVAGLASAVRSPVEPEERRWRAALWPGVVCAASIALVAVLQALAP
jgi:hypothetical protein